MWCTTGAFRGSGDVGALNISTTASPRHISTGPVPANVRTLLRLTDQFVLRSLDTTTYLLGDDLLKSIVYSIIWSVNVRRITRSATNSVYGQIEQLPPDSMREPVSVHALASSLRLPYETVRRAAAKLVADGICVRVPKRGLIVPAAVLNTPQTFESIRRNHVGILRFLGDLERAGYDLPFGHFKTPATPDSRLPNSRAVLRVFAEDMLRRLDAMAIAHDNNLLTGLIFTNILVASTAPILSARDSTPVDDPPPPLPDTQRQPVSVLAVAQSLRTPYETVRRHSNRLVKNGLCVRVAKRGIIVPQAAEAALEPLHVVRCAYANLTRMVNAIVQAGMEPA